MMLNILNNPTTPEDWICFRNYMIELVFLKFMYVIMTVDF